MAKREPFVRTLRLDFRERSMLTLLTMAPKNTIGRPYHHGSLRHVLVAASRAEMPVLRSPAAISVPQGGGSGRSVMQVPSHKLRTLST